MATRRKVDMKLFNALVRRCREVGDEMRVLQDQLAESQWFQSRENDLQNEIHRLGGMVDELREWNEGLVNDLADSNISLSRTTHVPVLPVSVPTEIASGSGDISSLVSKAVALALKEHMSKKALP
eukprot:13997827-Heterocapsa_arctica.AAC.1